MHHVVDFFLCALLGAMFLVSHIENKKKMEAIMEKLSSLDTSSAEQETRMLKVCNKLQSFKQKITTSKIKMHFLRNLVEDLEQQLAEHMEPVTEARSACDPPALCDTISLSDTDAIDDADSTGSTGSTGRTYDDDVPVHA